MSVSCGGDGESLETVYLHVFNAYPGSSSLSLYGASGAIVTDLAFGERTDEPVAVDRNISGEFTLILDGAPTVFEGTVDFFAMYPQETGTFLVSQRRQNTANVQVLRHTPSTSQNCRIAIHNSLAVSNDIIGQYSFWLAWRFAGNLEDAGYDQGAESAAGVAPRSGNLYNRIQANPYFVLVPNPDGDGLQFAWVGDDEEVDFSRADIPAGNLSTARPTQEYIECEQLNIVEDCNEPADYNTTAYSPDGGAVSEFIQFRPETLGNAPGDCSAEWRIYSDFGNIFGHDDDDNRVRVDHSLHEDTLFGPGNFLFFVLYGRPIDPRVLTWSTGDDNAFGVDPEDHDYPD